MMAMVIGGSEDVAGLLMVGHCDDVAVGRIIDG